MAHRSTLHVPGPVRTCVGCRKRAAVCELVRVTAGSDDEGHAALVLDLRGGAPGRGAHLHPTVACLDLAERRKAFPRALRVGHGLDVGSVREHVTTLAAQHDQQHEHNQLDQQQAPEHQQTRPPDQNWSSSS